MSGLGNGQRTLILTPAVPLNPATQYTITIAGVQDLSGNVLPAPVTTTFTTGGGADLIHPTVVAVNPANGATGVPVNTALQVQFSERIDPLTVTNSTFQVIAPGGVVLSGKITVSVDARIATFIPDVALLISTQYQIFATSGITDVAGLALNFFASSLITECEQYFDRCRWWDTRQQCKCHFRTSWAAPRSCRRCSWQFLHQFSNRSTCIQSGQFRRSENLRGERYVVPFGRWRSCASSGVVYERSRSRCGGKSRYRRS